MQTITIDGEELYIPSIGDTGELQESDWILSGDLLEQIKKAGNASPFRSVFNQYEYARHITSCTKFAPFNALCSDMGYTPTLEDIDDVEELSIKAGFVIGNGWSRGQGVDTVRRWWNAKFPNQEVASFTGALFTDEYYKILELGRTIICSINVDSKYWNDVLSDMKLDSLDFGMGGGHATAFRAIDGKPDKIRFLDSVGKRGSGLANGSQYTMEEAQLRFMNDPKRSMRSDFHFFIPKKIINMITKDVAEGQYYSDAVQRAIDNNITTEKDKFRPSEKITRAEAITWLYRYATKNEGTQG